MLLLNILYKKEKESREVENKRMHTMYTPTHTLYAIYTTACCMHIHAYIKEHETHEHWT